MQAAIVCAVTLYKDVDVKRDTGDMSPQKCAHL